MNRLFEYRTVRYYTESTKGLYVKAVNNTRPATLTPTGVVYNAPELHDYLNCVGKEGWEIHTMMGSSEEGLIVLQREVGGAPL